MTFNLINEDSTSFCMKLQLSLYDTTNSSRTQIIAAGEDRSSLPSEA
jgi:hypothetical protein